MGRPRRVRWGKGWMGDGGGALKTRKNSPRKTGSPTQYHPPRVRRDAVLREEIQRVWDENFQVYGAYKVPLLGWCEGRSVHTHTIPASSLSSAERDSRRRMEINRVEGFSLGRGTARFAPVHVVDRVRIRPEKQSLIFVPEFRNCLLLLHFQRPFVRGGSSQGLTSLLYCWTYRLLSGRSTRSRGDFDNGAKCV